ncbi:MAG: hypothetical protein ACK5IQ_11495 [Bacteroidales bacterium]
MEHAFRTLKSRLQIRPIHHWTNKRIEGHVAMCFMAYTMLNYLRLQTKMQTRELIRTIDKMQLSELQEGNKAEITWLRSAISPEQDKLIKSLKLTTPRDTTPQKDINQYFN